MDFPDPGDKGLVFQRLDGSWEGRAVHHSPAAGLCPRAAGTCNKISIHASYSQHIAQSGPLRLGGENEIGIVALQSLRKTTQSVGTQRKTDFLQFWMSAMN